jgi:hypothetical protein
MRSDRDTDYGDPRLATAQKVPTMMSEHRESALSLSPSTVYAALASRRATRDQMMWQVPTLTVGVQGLLIGWGLEGHRGLPARSSALLAAFLIGLLCAQLMAKHRYLERVDTAHLLEWELRHLDERFGDLLPHDHPFIGSSSPSDGHSEGLLTKAERLGIETGWWHRASSYRLWHWAVLFLAASALVGVLYLNLSAYL